MATKNAPLVYWDTNIWLSLLKGEKLPGDDRERVLEAARRVDRNEQMLLVSQPIRAEIFSFRLPDEAKSQFNLLLRSRAVQWKDMGPIAYEIRDELLAFYSKDSGFTKPLSQKDADHLAIAIHYSVSEFYTFDDGGKDGFSLLDLSGVLAERYTLAICKPPLPQQTSLDL